MKIGFELELFCQKVVGDGVEPCLVPAGLPYDECGWLVEVRSEPHTEVRKAIALFKSDITDIFEKAKRYGVQLAQVPLMEVPRDLKVQAARRFSKGKIKYRNVYGYETHRNKTSLQTASIHVSFTNQQEVIYNTFNERPGDNTLHRTERKFVYPGFVDHARIIVGLDRAFATEIRAAKRNPGFYEVKPDGRIEYRSLPNDIDLGKLQMVLEEVTK